MLTFLNGLRELSFLTVLLRLVLAFLCGGLIGLERSYKNRAAGFRTHILICVASAATSMTGLFLFLNAHLPTDISRLGAAVVAGLGFIGATIVVTRKKNIRGLTTAAGLWATGIIGLALGSGYYEGGIIAAILVLVTEIWISRFVQRIPPPPEFRLKLHSSQKTSLDSLLRYCKDHKLSITNLQVTGESANDVADYTALISLRAGRAVDMEALLDHVRNAEGIYHVEELAYEEDDYHS